MNVLVACEESQRVCKAFREKGHNAFSCDILPCSGGHPEWHIQGDVLQYLNPREFMPPDTFYFQTGIPFATMDDKYHEVNKWDLIIAHPPCTYLTITGNRHFNISKYGEKAILRYEFQRLAVDFFMQIVNANCHRIAIENPIGVMSTKYRKPDQIIHPGQFAITEEEKITKATCLWLKNLSPLIALNFQTPEITYHEWKTIDGKCKRQTLWYYNTRRLPKKERAQAASKTFPGIALAMANQWG